MQKNKLLSCSKQRKSLLFVKTKIGIIEEAAPPWVLIDGEDLDGHRSMAGNLTGEKAKVHTG